MIHLYDKPTSKTKCNNHQYSVFDRFGLGAKDPCKLIDKVFELTQLLLYTLSTGAVSWSSIVAQFFKSMLMHSFLLVIIGHALIIALFLDFFNYLLNITFDILSHSS